MLAFVEKPHNHLDRLDDELRQAPALTPALFAKLLTNACSRIAVLRRAGKTAQLDRLVAAGAWTDAACVLVELELPAWRVRRLVCENGAWLCTLSRQPHVPIPQDEAIDAWHEVLPLAILRAFVEARCGNSLTAKTAAPIPHVRPLPDALPDAMICCDNFA